LGSIRDIVNTSGTVLDHLSYDAYGNVLSESNSANGDKFKFDGMQFDAAINLYYDNARWYDAGNGRFVSIDPTGFAAGDQNLYRYVGNGPLIATDPTGLQDDPASTLESDAQMKNYKDYMEAQAAATKKLLELRDPQKEPESSTYVNSYADHVREGYYPGMNNVPSNYKRVTGTYYYYPENRQKGEPKRFYYYPPTNEPRRNLPQAIFYYGPNNPNNFIRFGPTSRSPRFYPNGTVSVPNGAGWGVPFQCGPGFTLTPTGPQSLPIPIAMPTL
jgi:RHS repeat-associated protein